MRVLILTLSRTRGSLTAVRALGRAGWTVGVGTPSGDGMVPASRFCSRAHVVPRPRGDGDAFVSGTIDAVEAGGYDLVVGGADDWMAALATYRRRIPATIAHPDGAVVARALDKVELTRRARDAGLAAPRTEVATDEQIARWRGPVVVKSRAHWRPGQQQRTRIEARAYRNIADARGRIAELRAAGLEPILQEPVEGELGALIGLVIDGRLVGRVQQRSPGLWPTPSGVSSRAYTVPVDEELAGWAESMLVGLGWSGLVELQFLIDADDRHHLIDLNGRYYGSMALAVAAGANLPDAWARASLGLPVGDLPDGRAGVRYVWTAGDLRRARVERRGGLVADVLDTVRWARRATTSVWDGDDRDPVRSLVRERLHRVGRDER